MDTLEDKIYDQVMAADKFHNLTEKEEMEIVKSIKGLVIDFGSRVYAACQWEGYNKLPTPQDLPGYMDFIHDKLKDEFEEV